MPEPFANSIICIYYINKTNQIEGAIMANLPGVTPATKKDGTIYYRSSMTIQSKHISLGSFPTEEQAAKAYQEAIAIIREKRYVLED